MTVGGEGGEPPRESTPEELKARIDEMKRTGRGDPQFARALGLVVSLGVAFIGSVYGAWVLGRVLEQHTGSQFWVPVALLVGVAMGGWVGYLLLRPLLRDG